MTDPCGMPFLWCRNLIHLPLLVVRVKLRLPTMSMIMRTTCLSGRQSQQLAGEAMMPCSVTGSSEIDKLSSSLLLSRKAVFDVLCQQGDLIYG